MVPSPATPRASMTTSWEWDLRVLDDYEYHPGLVKLGSRVLFGVDPLRRSLQARRIECKLGKIEPTDPQWNQACMIAMCAASTHLSLVRHFNWVHLAGAAQLAIATRNCLSANHPLCRLLWPFIFATQQSNDVVTRGRCRAVATSRAFSASPSRECADCSTNLTLVTHISSMTPRPTVMRAGCAAPASSADAGQPRGFFDVMHRFVCNYLTDLLSAKCRRRPERCARRQRDAGLAQGMNARVPNGVGVRPDDVTWDSLARLLARLLYLVTVQHETLGSAMWDYQVWPHRQPARVYEDLQRVPMDVYQRLINANYNLNVHRRALMDDYSHLALDDRAKAAMAQFQSELATLQEEMESRPYAVWRLYPRDLEVNINA